jgi:murein DD-endopeptidase MepM/ murein hydrolase activator NlpD
MKNLMCCLILSILLAVSCATHGPFYIVRFYGSPHSPHGPNGDGPHPGIDLGIPTGTPIIAASDGEIVYVGEPGGGGISVTILHGKNFVSLYSHLSRVFVEKGQSLKRGQLIGLSGACDSGTQHLTFCVYKSLRRWRDYSETYDPKKLWFGGGPRCFDPKMDYSAYSQKDITLPIACGDYAKELISKTK